MIKKKIIILFLALLMMLNLLVGCDGMDAGTEETTNKTESGVTNDPSDKETEPAVTEDTVPAVDVPSIDDNVQITVSHKDFPNALKAEKIGSVDITAAFTVAEGGAIYYSTGKYGIMSLDGKTNTGAIYGSCMDSGKYFVVSDKGYTFDEIKNMSADKLNICGLVDVNGKVLIPEKYANIEVISEKYARVMTLTGKTENKDEMLTYYSNNYISLAPDDDDILMTGVWKLYDIENGKIIDGISGTKAYSIDAAGDYIKYYTDAYEKKITHVNGSELPDSAAAFRDGCIEYDGIYYDADGTPRFKLEKDTVVYSSSDGYVVLKKYVNGSYKYRGYDRYGRAATAEFDQQFVICGSVILADGVYDFNGNLLAKCSTADYAVYRDSFIDSAYLIEDGNTYTLIKDDGSVLFTVTANEEHKVDTDSLIFKKGSQYPYVYYSLKDRDYILNATETVSSWLIEAKDENDYRNSYLIDTVSGEVILSGYYDYSASVNGSDYYVYAKTYGGGYDIYKIKPVA